MIFGKAKFLNVFSFITLSSALVLMLILAFWSLYPYKPADIKSIVVVDKEVQSGSLLTLDVDYCKYDDPTPLITTAFVNGVIFYLNDTSLSIERGCGINRIQILVPQEMTSGTYSIRRTWSWKVNPIKTITKTLDSNKFEILGSDKQRQLDQLQ